MILAIDFDGVIHDWQHPAAGRRMGAPVSGATEAVNELYGLGHTVIVHTCKAVTDNGKQAVEDWLDFYGIDHHQVTATKPKADYYIDDRALHFTSWPRTLIQLGLEDLEGDA